MQLRERHNKSRTMTLWRLENLVCRWKAITVVVRLKERSLPVYSFPDLIPRNEDGSIVHFTVEHNEPRPLQHLARSHSMVSIGIGFGGHRYATASRDWLSLTGSSMANPQEALTQDLNSWRIDRNNRYANALVRQLGGLEHNVGEAPTGDQEQPSGSLVQWRIFNQGNSLHPHHDDNHFIPARLSLARSGLYENRAIPNKLLMVSTIRYAISRIIHRFGLQRQHAGELLYCLTQRSMSQSEFLSKCLLLISQLEEQLMATRWGREWILACDGRETGRLSYQLMNPPSAHEGIRWSSNHRQHREPPTTGQ